MQDINEALLLWMLWYPEYNMNQIILCCYIDISCTTISTCEFIFYLFHTFTNCSVYSRITLLSCLIVQSIVNNWRKSCYGL